MFLSEASMTEAPAKHPSDWIPTDLPSDHFASQAAIAAALTLMLVVLWCATHRFIIFASDGVLYAVQAMARLIPVLGQDVYLANTSQDQFTVFSRIYAWFIGWFGLGHAALSLFLICTVTFAAAAWTVARGLLGSRLAWLAVLMLIVTKGSYGASSVFYYSENYLTARSLAEALIVVALAAHVYGWKLGGLMVAAAAMFVHPLMALPGLLLLIFMWLPIKYAAAGAAAGCLATLAIALAAVALPPSAHFLTVMDQQWLEVVRERSQFLFLKYWSLGDWETQVRPFLCLTLSLWVIDDARVRRLCVAAMLVGAAGLVVALIACSVGPVAILLQGQAWRWFWVTGFIGVLLLAPTAVCAWRNPQCGPICATLIIAGWTFPAVNGIALITLALLLWSLRSRIDSRTGQLLRWAAYALIGVIAAWALANSWSVITSPRVVSGHESPLMDHIKSVLAMQVFTVAVFGLFWYGMRSFRSPAPPLIAAALLAGSLAVIVPDTLALNQTAGSAAEIAQFDDWRTAMSGPGSVLIVSSKQWVAFVWFILQRPSYTSPDQSAGVVFARETALEIRRRSDVLLPIMKPNWQILSQLAEKAHGKKLEDTPRPLTAENLAAVCRDPELGYVVAKENLGFDAIRHTHAGPWKDWNLYDCRRVRAAGSLA